MFTLLFLVALNFLTFKMLYIVHATVNFLNSKFFLVKTLAYIIFFKHSGILLFFCWNSYLWNWLWNKCTDFFLGLHFLWLLCNLLLAMTEGNICSHILKRHQGWPIMLFLDSGFWFLVPFFWWLTQRVIFCFDTLTLLMYLTNGCCYSAALRLSGQQSKMKSVFLSVVK